MKPGSEAGLLIFLPAKLISALFLPTTIIASSAVVDRNVVQLFGRLDRAERSEIDGPLIFAAAVVPATALLLLPLLDQVL
jgi:hypothetical protein